MLRTAKGYFINAPVGMVKGLAVAAWAGVTDPFGTMQRQVYMVTHPSETLSNIKAHYIQLLETPEGQGEVAFEVITTLLTAGDAAVGMAAKGRLAGEGMMAIEAGAGAARGPGRWEWLLAEKPGAPRPNVPFQYVNDLWRTTGRVSEYSKATGIRIQSGLPKLVELGALRHEYAHMLLAEKYTHGVSLFSYYFSNVGVFMEELSVHLYATQNLEKAILHAIKPSYYFNSYLPRRLVFDALFFGGPRAVTAWLED